MAHNTTTMKEFKQGTNIGRFTVLYPITNKEYTQTYCVADKHNNQYFMKVYDMVKIPDVLRRGEDPQEVWAYEQIGVCDNLLRLYKHGYEIIDGNKIAYLVTNFFQGKLLSQYIDEKGCLPYDEALDIALGIVNAVRHLNKHSICHLDITPQNILLEDDLQGGFIPKLFDLELAVEYNEQGETRCSPRRLEKINPYYSRSELLMKQEVSEEDDTFSIGAIIYTMITAKRPWADCTFKPDITYAEKHLQMNKWRHKHPANSIIEPLHPTNNDVSQASANLYVAMEQTMDHQINTDTLERILKRENTDLNKIALEVAREDTRSAEDLTGFASIAGMDDLKQNLSQHVIWPLRHPEKAKEYRINLPNGLLLYGPPGCGKTYFATKLASELRWKMKLISTASIGSAYQHETQSNIRQLFMEAERFKPCVLCIDEIDGILSVRGDAQGDFRHNDEVNEFLVQLNNCNQRGILVVGTTNRKELIDPAALRAGRLEVHVEIKAPDEEMRKRLFEMYLRNRPLADDIDIPELAKLTKGYASVDVTYVVNEAALVAAIADEPISQQHLVSVIRNHPSSLQAATKRIGFE